MHSSKLIEYKLKDADGRDIVVKTTVASAMFK